MPDGDSGSRIGRLNSLSETSCNVAAARGVVERLRADTREAHQAIESLLDFTAGTMTLASYRRRLARFYGFYCPLEARLQAVAGPAAAALGMSLAGRAKTPLLVADLAALGSPPVSQLPLCDALPDLAGNAAAWGCMYVLEGATLGGQVISRIVRDRLGVTAGTGGLFFQGYGARTGAMWLEMRTALAAVGADADNADAMVASAIDTFHSMHRWCESDPAT